MDREGAVACRLIQHWVNKGLLDEAGRAAAEKSLVDHSVTQHDAAALQTFLQHFLKSVVSNLKPLQPQAMNDEA